MKTENQVADAFTKGLFMGTFEKMVGKLGMIDI